MSGRISTLLGRFWQTERGSVTIEAVIWLPTMILLTGLMFDLTLILMHHADMWSMASDVSRQIAIGAIQTTDAQTYVDQLSMLASGYTVSAQVASGLVTLDVSIPWTDVTATAWFLDNTAQMHVSIVQRMEPTT